MYKIYNYSIVYKLLLFIPFVGIIANNLNPVFSYIAIIFFGVMLLLFKVKLNQITKMQIFVSSIFLLNLYVVFLYQLIAYDFVNLYFIQFFGSQLLFYFIFTNSINIKEFSSRYFHRIFEFMVYLTAFFIVVDFILLTNGMESSQLMYKPEAMSYRGKPLGLFGQFSINTTFAVVFYMLHLSFQRVRNVKKNIILFLLVTLIIILQNSGTGYVMYLLLLFTIFYKSFIFRFIYIPIIIISMLYIIQNNLVAKLSLDYLVFLYEYFVEIFKVTYFDNIHNIFDFLFGIDGNYNFPIDFGPMFMIAKVGFLYFVLYSLVILYMIYKSPDRYFRMAVISLIIANLHYPALFYPVMNVLLPILLIYIKTYRFKFINHGILEKGKSNATNNYHR